MKVAFLTANFADFDNVHAPIKQSGIEYEYFCFNESNTPLPLSALSPRMKAKYFKCQTHKILKDFDVYCWIDARIKVKSNLMLHDFLQRLQGYDIAIGTHQDRDCIFDEAIYVHNSVSPYIKSRYKGLPIMQEADSYRKQGHREHWGLFSAGIFIRWNNEKMNDIFNQWWESCIQWSYFDQLSLPFLLRKNDAKINRELYGHILNNEYFELGKHK